jgi:acyl-CoA thioesterase-1
MTPNVRLRSIIVAGAIWSSVWVAGCRREAPVATDEAPPAPAADPDTSTGPDRPRIVVLGDSLTAGLGLPVSEAFPQRLQGLLDARGKNYEVVNAGVSGDTTAGGVRRLDWSLDGDVRVLIVALGGNDGLRGLPVSAMKQNLATIIERARSRGIRVILAGMEAPPNFGPSYTREFRQAYVDLAREHQVELVPFLLEGVAGDPLLNQSDGIHPNAQGAKAVADHLWRALEPVLAADR